jgi:hypothetical protein
MRDVFISVSLSADIRDQVRLRPSCNARIADRVSAGDET